MMEFDTKKIKADAREDFEKAWLDAARTLRCGSFCTFYDKNKHLSQNEE